MRIAIAGTGYVGMANAILLAQHNRVFAFDISAERIGRIRRRESPIKDEDMARFLASPGLDLHATLDKDEAYHDAVLVVVATPTNYDPTSNRFDTSSIESVVADVRCINPNSTILIKSTVPVGYTERLREMVGTKEIVFSPEFLREGKALHDNLHPSRIVVGDRSSRGRELARLFSEGALKKNVPTLLTGSTEAEAIKLFANTYLALRVAFFNELDTYGTVNNLSTRDIIEAIGLDPRIGSEYNNPSFGYGGYCLPKDTKQLLANYKNVPQDLIRAVVEANATRKAFIADHILVRKPKLIGIYRLVMKSGSDNFRDSSILSVIERLKGRGVGIAIHEPTLEEASFLGLPVVNDLLVFKSRVELIVTNRVTEDLNDVLQKVCSRDLFGCD